MTGMGNPLRDFMEGNIFAFPKVVMNLISREYV